MLLGWNSYLPPKDAFPKAKIAAMRALRLDPDLGEAHTPLATVLWLYEWQWQQAREEFERSLALNPAYPTANHYYAEYLMTMGRHAEAIEKMKSSQELDPLSLIISVAIGWAFYMARRYDEAIEQLRRTIELEPNYPMTCWILGLALRKSGRYDIAILEGEKGVELSGGSPLMSAALAQTLAIAGKRKRAVKILGDLTKLGQTKVCFTLLSCWNPRRFWRSRTRDGISGESLRGSLPLVDLPSHRSEHGPSAGRTALSAFVAACWPSFTATNLCLKSQAPVWRSCSQKVVSAW